METQLNEPTNQNSIKVSKFIKLINKKTFLQIFGTSVINSPMSPPSKPGSLGDKIKDNKLMHNPNDHTQNYPFLRFRFLLIDQSKVHIKFQPCISGSSWANFIREVKLTKLILNNWKFIKKSNYGWNRKNLNSGFNSFQANLF